MNFLFLKKFTYKGYVWLQENLKKDMKKKVVKIENRKTGKM